MKLLPPALALSVTFATFAANAQSAMDPEAVRECVRVHDSGRLLWNDGHWLEAREVMKGCVDPRCPAAIGAECRAWQDELTRDMPSLSISVQHAEGDDESARATAEVDGDALATAEPFGRIEVNPGRHVVRVRLLEHEPIEQSVVAPAESKNIAVFVRFKHEPAASAPPEIRSARPIPSATYWLAGGALAAFAASGAFLWSALAQRADAEKDCAPVCDSDTVAQIRRQAVAADILGVAGLTLTGFAIATFVARPTVSEPVPTSRVALRGVRGGAALELAGVF